MQSGAASRRSVQTCPHQSARGAVSWLVLSSRRSRSSGFGVRRAGAEAEPEGQEGHPRASCARRVKKNPGVVRRKSFLRKAALVNFKLPVTIRLRNPCTPENGREPGGTATTPPVRRSRGELRDAGHGAQRAHVPVGDRQPRPVARHAGRSPSAARSPRSSSSRTRMTAARSATSTSRSSRSTTSSSRRRRSRSCGTTTSPTRPSATTRTSCKATSSLTGLSETGVEQGCGDFQSAPTTSTGGIVPAGLQLAVPRVHADLQLAVPGGRRHPRLPVLRPGGSGRLTSRPATSRSTRASTRSTRSRPAASSATTTGSARTRTRSRPAPRRRTPATRRAAAVQLQRGEHGAAHERAAPGDRARRRLGEHEHRDARRPPARCRRRRARRTSRSATPAVRRTCSGTSRARTSGIDVTVNLAAEISGHRPDHRSGQSSSSRSSRATPTRPASSTATRSGRGTVQNYIPGVRLTGTPADRAGDHEGRQGPDRQGDGRSPTPNNPDRVALTACLTARSAYLEYNDEQPARTSGFSDDSTVVSKIPYVDAVGHAGTPRSPTASCR